MAERTSSFSTVSPSSVSGRYSDISGIDFPYSCTGGGTLTVQPSLVMVFCYMVRMYYSAYRPCDKLKL